MNASENDGYSTVKRERRAVLSTERSTADSLRNQGPVHASESRLVRWVLLGIPLFVLLGGTAFIIWELLRIDTGNLPSQPATAPSGSRPDIAPALPSHTKLTRIAFGSCLSQRHPQPIWRDVLAVVPRPQMFLMMGDNVYGDVTTPALTKLSDAYQT